MRRRVLGDRSLAARRDAATGNGAGARTLADAQQAGVNCPRPADIVLALWQAPAGARKLNRLRDITASLNISERSAFGIITDLAQTGYVVKEKDGPRCTWPRSWRPGCAILAGTRLARMSCRCWQTAQRRLAPPTTPAWPG